MFKVTAWATEVGPYTIRCDYAEDAHGGFAIRVLENGEEIHREWLLARAGDSLAMRQAWDRATRLRAQFEPRIRRAIEREGDRQVQ